MITDLVNGYNITGNHGTGAGREYRICNAAGKVLQVCPTKAVAMADVLAREPGDILPVPEPKAVVEPKPEAAAPQVKAEEAPQETKPKAKANRSK